MSPRIQTLLSNATRGYAQFHSKNTVTKTCNYLVVILCFFSLLLKVEQGEIPWTFSD